jgi:hypothetical protein
VYEIEFVSPISQQVRKITKEYFKALNDISPITHNLLIRVWPLEWVYDDEYKRCLGLFIYSEGRHRPEIVLAGRQPLNEYIDTLCHEFVHFEQFRDGWDVKEGGVSVRARNLVSVVGESLSPSLCL